MGLSFVFQTAIGMFTGDAAEEPAKKQANQRFDYEAAVEKQRQEGGPRRFYDDGELDIESARVTDENGNPVDEAKAQGSYDGREFIHVNVSYCIS